jgi:hypothetical protein
MLAAMVMLAGCAGAHAQRAIAPEPAGAGAQIAVPAASAAQSSGARGRDVTGLWQGTSTAGCLPFQPDARRCNAVVKITLRIFQQGSALSGDYTCAMGTMVCRDTNTSGVIAHGEVRDDGVALRVMMPDGSSCLFNGHRVREAMVGTYFCMQGGGYIEQGRFAVERGY